VDPLVDDGSVDEVARAVVDEAELVVSCLGRDLLEVRLLGAGARVGRGWCKVWVSVGGVVRIGLGIRTRVQGRVEGRVWVMVWVRVKVRARGRVGARVGTKLRAKVRVLVRGGASVRARGKVWVGVGVVVRVKSTVGTDGRVKGRAKLGGVNSGGFCLLGRVEGLLRGGLGRGALSLRALLADSGLAVLRGLVDSGAGLALGGAGWFDGD
jgi:hypothetical protein